MGFTSFVSAFLEYVFYYLWKFCGDLDCSLDSIEKLAKATERGTDGIGSTFDSLHGIAINSSGAAQKDRNHLSMLYGKYLDNLCGDPHVILTRAVRLIRKNWYAYLGRTMG